MQEGKQYKTFYIRKKNNTMSMGSFFILIPKNGNAKECSSYHTIVFISHVIVARLCSKSFKLGFNNTWTKNFQMYKLGFEEAEETEIRLPSFVGSWRKQEKTSTSASLTALKPLTVWITTNCGKFLKRWEYQTILPVSCKVSMQVTKHVRTGRGATHWLRIGKVGWQGCIL